MPVLRSEVGVRTIIKNGIQRSLVCTDHLMTVVVEISNGPWLEPEPMHDHIHEQTTYIAEGELIFFCEDEPPQRLKAGDLFYIPSNRKHAIQLLSSAAKLVDSFTPQRTEFLVKTTLL
ncbi:MAG: cupin domain-containing protein [Bacteroidota bacterium]